MMIEPIITFLVIVGVLSYVVRPLIRRAEYHEKTPADTKLRNLEQEKFNIYAQIKETDFEYEMGKLGRRDYSFQRDELMEKASRIIDEIEQYKSSLASPYSTSGSPDPARRDKACPDCGHAVPPTRAKYCPSCGNRLQNTCEECGNVNPPESKYCASCGYGLVTA